jgi:hypothetical protein
VTAMDDTHCPKCNRDYELPKRCTLRSDDLEFLCAPRMLDCLHTCCHSCLEEIFQKGGELHEIECPICKRKKHVESVSVIPFDPSAIERMILKNKLVSSTCNRCRDDVPSFSWCSNCSIALCEFHHQDHKLSLYTSKHNIQTLGELAYNKTEIVQKLPPIPCPGDASRDCTIFCHVCGYLVSAEVSFYTPLKILINRLTLSLWNRR